MIRRGWGDFLMGCPHQVVEETYLPYFRRRAVYKVFRIDRSERFQLEILLVSHERRSLGSEEGYN